ncbi:hypothetical protein [Streptomyces sp. KL116D]|uniref:hypothetical protein n=1 Tax=Streptomyces sp. KL116D TaxID=3045152 RepID=UPI0035586C3F
MGIEGATPGAVRAAVERVMRARGRPAPAVPAGAAARAGEALLTRKGFGGYPWKLRPEYGPTDTYPNTLAVIEDSLTLQRWHLNPAAGPVLQDRAAAFEKVWANLDRVATLARTMSPAPAESGPMTVTTAATAAATTRQPARTSPRSPSGRTGCRERVLEMGAGETGTHLGGSLSAAGC